MDSPAPASNLAAHVPLKLMDRGRSTPAKLCSLFKKKLQLPVAASAYWSLATMIAATMVVDAPED